MAQNVTLQKIDEYRWRIPKSYMKGMRVDGIVYANEKLLENAKNDEALQQVANVAHLPGIVKHSLAMPDLHWGLRLRHRGCCCYRPTGGWRGFPRRHRIRHQLRSPPHSDEP